MSDDNAQKIHKAGIVRALEFLSSMGLTARKEVWIGITAPNSLQQPVQVDTVGFKEDVIIAAVEVGGIGGKWYAALAPIVSMYHWPYKHGLWPQVLEDHPHQFGNCVECPPLHLPGFTIHYGRDRFEALGIIRQIQ